MDLLRENNFPIDLLPTVVNAGYDAGNLLQKWFFIPEGTPVTSGMGDLQVGGLVRVPHDLNEIISVQFLQVFSKIYCDRSSHRCHSQHFHFCSNGFRQVFYFQA